MTKQSVQQQPRSLYLPLPGEVTYNFSLLSHRMLYVREQLLKKTRGGIIKKFKFAETSFKAYEKGLAEPSIPFISSLADTDYAPYILFILTGAPGVTLPTVKTILPMCINFSDRLFLLRTRILKMSREKMSEHLNGFSPYNIKNYERDVRKPGINFIQLCASNELMKPYFYWLIWGKAKPIKQNDFILIYAGDGDRSRYTSRMSIENLHRPLLQCLSSQDQVEAA